MAAKKLVTIRLRALGETSPFTGGVVFRKGGTRDVDTKMAAAAVATGRWEFASADDEKTAEEPDGA